MLDAVADTAGGCDSNRLFTAAGTRLPAATDIRLFAATSTRRWRPGSEHHTSRPVQPHPKWGMASTCVPLDSKHQQRRTSRPRPSTPIRAPPTHSSFHVKHATHRATDQSQTKSRPPRPVAPETKVVGHRIRHPTNSTILYLTLNNSALIRYFLPNSSL